MFYSVPQNYLTLWWEVMKFWFLVSLPYRCYISKLLILTQLVVLEKDVNASRTTTDDDDARRRTQTHSNR